MKDLILTRLPRSHRKNNKIINLLGFRPQHYFSLYSNSQFIYLKPEDFEKVKNLVTRTRFKENILQCWNTGVVDFGKNFESSQPYETP